MFWSRIARFIMTLCVILLATLGSAHAQTAQPPTYVYNIIDPRIAESGDRVEVDVVVSNIGGAATFETIVELTVLNEGDPRVIGSARLRPLAANNDRDQLALSAPIAEFSAGSRQVFGVRITSPLGQPAVNTELRPFSLNIPLPVPGSGGGQAISTPQPNTTPETDSDTANAPIVIRIPLPGNDLLLNLGTGQEVALTVGVIGAGLMLVWLLSVLLRLMFRRPPNFGMQQAPYINMPPLHPQSISGIRQQWQQVAQNNAITVPPMQGATHAVKRLIGSDGRYLSGWKITALRMSQYDQYGRVARSQIIPSRRIVRQIARIARKSQQLDAKRLQRRTRPLGKALAKPFLKRVTRRSAMLPIALDVRLVGTHGEVNIVFEVYGCQGQGQNGVWQLLDQWLPDMVVTGKTIYENYTYTIYGQTGGESFREFRRRLPTDIARALALLIEARPPEAPKPQPQPRPQQPSASVGIDTAAGSSKARTTRETEAAAHTPARNVAAETAAKLPAVAVADEPAPAAPALHETSPNPRPIDEAEETL